MSITASINIYYIYFPDGKTVEKYNKSGLPLPKETECHLRFPLEKNDDQLEYTKTISNKIERNRKDIWWIDPDGGNIETVILDLKETLIKYAFQLVERPCYAFEEQLRRFKSR